jgi:hypothetical protein
VGVISAAPVEDARLEKLIRTCLSTLDVMTGVLEEQPLTQAYKFSL